MEHSVVLLTLGIVNTLPHLLTKIRISGMSKKPTAQPKGMLLSVGIDLLQIIVHLGQDKPIPPKSGGGGLVHQRQRPSTLIQRNKS